MRLKRLGLEFRVKLATEKPRVVWHFHNFDVILVGGPSGDPQACGREGLFKLTVKFIAMAMALTDFGFAVGFVGKGAGFEQAGPGAEAHRASHFVNAKEFAKLVNDAI